MVLKEKTIIQKFGGSEYFKIPPTIKVDSQYPIDPMKGIIMRIDKKKVVIENA